VAVSDLKGLGAKEGSPVVYTWTMPSLMPLLLPWIVLLVMLALRANRDGRAWWILLPVGIWAGFGLALQNVSGVEGFSSGVLEQVQPFLAAGAFGFAALLLLGHLLAGKPWPLVFLGMCAAQTIFSLIAMAASADAESFPSQLAMGVVLAISGFGVTLALTLAGLLCRRRYRAVRLSLWLLVWLLAGWLLVALPFTFIAAFSDAFIPWPAILLGCGVMAGVSFLAVLPFLILCFANSFYGERLRAMLGVKEKLPEPPPVPGITPTAQTA
jgi:hypothetical protein